MKRYLAVALLLAALGVSLFVTLYKPAGECIKDAFFYLSELGWIGYVLLVCLVAACVICSIPNIVPNLALCALFSFPVAFSISMAGFSLGVSTVYWIMRVCKWKPSDRFRRLHEAMKREPFKYTLIARFTLIPSAVKNYGLASCPISYVCYVTCTVIHGAVVNGLETATAYQLWHSGSIASYVILASTLCLGLTMLILISWLAYRALRRAESDLLVLGQGMDEIANTPEDGK